MEITVDTQFHTLPSKEKKKKEEEKVKDLKKKSNLFGNYRWYSIPQTAIQKRKKEKVKVNTYFHTPASRRKKNILNIILYTFSIHTAQRKETILPNSKNILKPQLTLNTRSRHPNIGIFDPIQLRLPEIWSFPPFSAVKVSLVGL